MTYLEILVEEPSAEALLLNVLPMIIPADSQFAIRVFDGKTNLLKKLPDRLQGYSHYSPRPKILVLVDRDDDDCLKLKDQLEGFALSAGLATKASAGNAPTFEVCNRIVVEELEAWIIGDEVALRTAFPRLGAYADKARYRDPDSIAGGTWEALENLLKRAGYYQAGLAKIDCAARVSKHFDIPGNRSNSFQQFVAGTLSLIHA